MLRLNDFRGVVPDERLAEIYNRARKLYGKHIVHLNATYQGGGVAEILYSLAMLMNDVGIDTGWRILHGSQEFFEITKGFHNAVQGADIDLSDEVKKTYVQVNRNFSRFTHLKHDCIIIHDPQPLSLIQNYRKCQPWIWRCHIDITNPNPQLWDFMKGFMLKYDEIVVSSERYIKEDMPINQRIMYPAINPLSTKNVEISKDTINEYIDVAGIPRDKPIVTQVSRLDPWKDPLGVIEVFKIVREKFDCRLLFTYNAASDDPEGMRMYEKTLQAAGSLYESGDILFVVGNNETLVNAIQTCADVVIQKSTKEGFCLTVTEAMWKGNPVVGSTAGGIPIQIEDGVNGYLVDPMDYQAFAERVIYLLENPGEKEKMGQAARETVRNKFLITRLLSDYLDMLNSVL